ncbi:SDR family oxidoreductase [Staphylospora marina]|uniref:SDR family oxidoreductase n=1 Tax=Staphylospora marina TaxID=2490858 RepID=UPI000F5BC302|nr:SDR family oxidoreductase [Staphylospora marina]
MKILIIGGTRFLGRFITREAQRRGHEITLFHRGRANPGLFPDVENILGDRVEAIGLLGDRRWDSVIDTCGFVPWAVAPSVRYLKNRTEHYVFVSSISVYADFSRIGIDESSPVDTLPEKKVEELEREGYGPYGEHYGAMKALCERLIDREMPGRALHVRSGLIVGPHDYMDRFPYWIHRVARGGEILAPGHPGQPVQWIDVRDLANWILDMAERRQTGVMNVTGPETPLTMGHILEECRRIAGSEAEFTWVDEEFLLERQVQPWTELPLWLPVNRGLSDGEKPPVGFFRVNIDRALQTGLSFRPLSETISDTLQWLNAENKDAFIAGLIPEKERRLLSEWNEKKARS